MKNFFLFVESKDGGFGKKHIYFPKDKNLNVDFGNQCIFLAYDFESYGYKVYLYYENHVPKLLIDNKELHKFTSHQNFEFPIKTISKEDAIFLAKNYKFFGDLDLAPKFLGIEKIVINNYEMYALILEKLNQNKLYDGEKNKNLKRQKLSYFKKFNKQTKHYNVFRDNFTLYDIVEDDVHNNFGNHNFGVNSKNELLLLDFPFFQLKDYYTTGFKNYLNNNFNDKILIYDNYPLEKEI